MHEIILYYLDRPAFKELLETFNQGCPSKSVNCKLSRDDGLLPIFNSKLGIISLKQHRGHIENLLRQIYLLYTGYQGLNKQQSIITCALIVHSLCLWKDNLNWISCIWRVFQLREPLSILIKYKTIDTPKIDNILKIYFDVSTKL